MSILLHVYKHSEATEALVDGRDVRAVCGEVVHPKTVDGHIIPPGTTGNSICMDCIGEVGPELAVEILAHHKSSVSVGAQ